MDNLKNFDRKCENNEHPQKVGKKINLPFGAGHIIICVDEYMFGWYSVGI